MIKLKIRKNQLLMFTIALILGLVISVGVFNYQQDQQVKFDITWIEPHQAIIFWKTENPAHGYIKYGDKRFQLFQTKHQTNEQKSTLHVAVLEDLPREGIFIALHTDRQSVFRWPKSINIKYTSPENE